MSELNTAANNIYNRLRSAPTFHPANADLFSDWNIQAGDVVTVKSDSESYQVPVYNMKLKWTGAPKVEVESTGNPEREPLPAIKRREYAANSSNYSEQKSLRGGVGAAQSGVREINGVLYAAGLQVDPVTGVWLYASENASDYALGSSFKVQADAITAEVTRATRAEGEANTRITQTADAISAEVTRATAAEGTLSSSITQTADAITAEVSRATTEEGRLSSSISVNAAQIALKVSKNDVATQLAVECGNVTISNGNLVVDGYVTADTFNGFLRGNVNATDINATSTITAPTLYANSQLSIGTGSGGSLYYRGTQYVRQAITLGAYGAIASGYFLGDSSTALNLDHYHAITAEENNGIVTITQGAVQSTPGTDSFNIADTQFYQDGVSAARIYGAEHATLGGSWSNGEYTVNVSYGGSVRQSQVMVELDDISGGTPTASGTTLTVPCAVTDTNGAAVFTDNISVSAASVYNAVTISSIAKDGSASYSSNYKTVYIPVTATASNGNSDTVTISCDITDAYEAGQQAATANVVKGSWSNGLVSFTPSQGSGTGASVSLTQGVTSWNDTTATVYINDNASGSPVSTGKTVTVDALDIFTQVSVTPIGSPRYFKSDSIAPIGTAYVPVKRTGNLLGSTYVVTLQGTPVDVYPIAGTSLKLRYYANIELYQKVGSTYTRVGDGARSWYYVNSSGTTYWQSGSKQTYYTAGGTATYYGAGSAFTYYDVGTNKTLYEAGTTVTRYESLPDSTGATNTYYLPGTAATYYTKN